MGNLTFGKSDTAGNGVEGSGNSGSNARAIWSYNNAIATLNNKVRSFVVDNDGIVTKAMSRSVGSVPSNPEDRNINLYHEIYDNTAPEVVVEPTYPTYPSDPEYPESTPYPEFEYPESPEFPASPIYPTSPTEPEEDAPQATWDKYWSDLATWQSAVATLDSQYEQQVNQIKQNYENNVQTLKATYDSNKQAVDQAYADAVSAIDAEHERQLAQYYEEDSTYWDRYYAYQEYQEEYQQWQQESTRVNEYLAFVNQLENGEGSADTNLIDEGYGQDLSQMNRIGFQIEDGDDRYVALAMRVRKEIARRKK